MNLPGPEKVSGKQLVPLWKRESTFLPRPDRSPFFFIRDYENFHIGSKKSLLNVVVASIIPCSLVGATVQVTTSNRIC